MPKVFLQEEVDRIADHNDLHGKGTSDRRIAAVENLGALLCGSIKGVSPGEKRGLDGQYRKILQQIARDESSSGPVRFAALLSLEEYEQRRPSAGRLVQTLRAIACVR